MNGWQVLADAALSLIPPAMVGVLFYFLMRSIIRADRGERDEYSKIEAEERALRKKK